MECGDYFSAPQGEIEQWIFARTPPEWKDRLPPFRIPRFPQTLSTWVNRLIDTGFVVERFDEPTADDDVIRRHPGLHATRIIAFFLIIRCRKPAS